MGEFFKIGEKMYGFNSASLTDNLAPRIHEQILFWISTLPAGPVAHLHHFCLLRALSPLGKMCFILPPPSLDETPSPHKVKPAGDNLIVALIKAILCFYNLST